jgi:outer membrane protein OmpA-like peptidoglycan-associated protein
LPDSTFEERADTRESFVLRDVQFATGSARLLPESFASLDSLAEQLLANTSWKLEINGHTDNQGDPEDNLKLSVKRSKAVFDYLAKKGVPAEGMKYSGKGDSESLEDNETEEGRAINRRVEFVIKK